jgi:hypothetical protein
MGSPPATGTHTSVRGRAQATIGPAHRNARVETANLRSTLAEALPAGPA